MVGPPSPVAAARLTTVLDPVIPQLGELMGRRSDVLSLAQGMVGWGPPAEVLRAVHEVLDQPGLALHRYGSTWGNPELLEAVARKLKGRNGLDLNGTTLLVTTGSNMAFAAIAQVICDPGSEVIFPVPYYFNHAMAVQLVGAVVVPVEAGAIPDPALLEEAIGPHTRAIVTVSPNNPSGVVIPPDVLKSINQLCARRGLWHISDEAYEDFVHGEVPHFSPGSLVGAASHTLSLYSLSKAYGMAGWRMGYAAVPEGLRPALAKVIDTLEICPTAISQRAAAAALAMDPSWIREQVASLGPRRAQLLGAVQSWQEEGMPLGLWAEPDGAFYGLLVVNSPAGRLLASEALMAHLVQEHGVAAVSGSAFGLEIPGACLLRLSYGMLERADLTTALGRLGEGLRQWSAAV